MCADVRIRIFCLNTCIYIYTYLQHNAVYVFALYSIFIHLSAQHPFLCQVAMHNLGKKLYQAATNTAALGSAKVEQ